MAYARSRRVKPWSADGMAFAGRLQCAQTRIRRPTRTVLPDEAFVCESGRTGASRANTPELGHSLWFAETLASAWRQYRGRAHPERLLFIQRETEGQAGRDACFGGKEERRESNLRSALHWNRGPGRRACGLRVGALELWRGLNALLRSLPGPAALPQPPPARSASSRQRRRLPIVRSADAGC